MPRIRYLKPEFFKDEDLAEHPFWVRLLFSGLWTIADKEGRLEDRSKRIKADLFPYDNVDIEKGLEELARIKNHSLRPFIQRYEVNGEKYIQIINWNKHQKIHHTEKESVISPVPPLNLNLKGKGKQLEESMELNNGELTVKTPLKCFFNFESLWLQYPNRVGKKEAEKHFKASVSTDKDWNDINSALNNYKRCDKVSKGFIQNGSTWFNNWRDWVNPSKEMGVKPKPKELKPKAGCEFCKGTGYVKERNNVRCICWA